MAEFKSPFLMDRNNNFNEESREYSNLIDENNDGLIDNSNFKKRSSIRISKKKKSESKENNRPSSTNMDSSKTVKKKKKKESVVEEPQTVMKNPLKSQNSRADLKPKPVIVVESPSENEDDMDHDSGDDSLSVSTASASYISTQNEIKSIIKDYYEYDFSPLDFSYLNFLFINLPKLNDTWDRIGFHDDIKTKRLKVLFKKLKDTFQDMFDGEEELEQKITKSIYLQRQSIKDLCFELALKYESLPIFAKKNLTILEEDELLRVELKRLQAERTRRMEDYKKILVKEEEFCNRLGMNPTEKKTTVPSEGEIHQLKQRLSSLEKLFNDRKKEMTSLKDEILTLSEDLEVSRSDTIAEMMLYESVDDMQLSERELQRAQDFRNELNRKNTDILDEIRSLKFKIKELWSKLNIDNINMIQYLNSDTNNLDIPKRILVSELRKEYDRCIKIKMENMQKFIETIRKEIKDYCLKMFISDKDMKRDYNDIFSQTEYTEELLNEHEKRLDDLKFNFEEFSSLYEKTSKWMQLWNDFLQFEEKTKDPLRFKTRGHNMLEEEKQRKNFNNQLPRLEEELTNLAEEYQKTNGGNEFKIMGLYYLEYINRKKYDHEQSKQNERKEKQILRENNKKNESRFGSKPATPLALKNAKRKLGNGASVHETQLNTPNASRSSKLQRTDQTTLNTPGSVLGTSRLTTNKSTIRAVVPNKSRMTNAAAIKRKSRTPANARRKSKMLLAAAAARAHETEINATSGDSEADKTLRTTTVSQMSSISSVTSSMYQSTSRTNISTASQSIRHPTKASNPPLSSSSKYSTIGKAKPSSSLQRMTSTASNSMLEDNFDVIEKEVKGQELISMAAGKLNKLASIKTTTTTKTSINVNNDVNYFEFTRDLPKTFRFGGKGTGSDESGTSNMRSETVNSSTASRASTRSSSRK